jgi:hypothetical protein
MRLDFKNIFKSSLNFSISSEVLKQPILNLSNPLFLWRAACVYPEQLLISTCWSQMATEVLDVIPYDGG